MQPNSKIAGSVPSRQAWFISTTTTIGGHGGIWETSDTAFDHGLVGILTRMSEMATADQELTLLVDEEAGDLLRLRLPVSDPDNHPVRRDVGAAGWKSSKIGFWSTFYGQDRPTVHVGQIDEIEMRARNDRARWPFGRWIGDIVAQCQRWADLTGVAWQAEPAVMGVTMMRQLLPSYRVPGVKGYRRPTKVDERTPELAGESVWTPDAWSRGLRTVAAELDVTDGKIFFHWYDKVKAGLTAAGMAKLAAEPLRHWVRPQFDGKRGGWWLISKPPWNEPRLPHPAGPTGKVWERIWVSTPTMDLLAELAEQGRVDMPEPIESFTGLARPLLRPWYEALWSAYSAPVTDRYTEMDQGRIRAAVAEVATRGIGMLAHHGSSVYRPDWFGSITATKRANGWRMADRISHSDDRWPVMIDDDSLCYASTDPDPVTAAPAGFSAPTAGGKPRTLGGSEPGDYRAEPDKSTVRLL